MTIDERTEALMATLPYLHKSEGGVEGFRERLRLALLETARDQKHACAEAVSAAYVDDYGGSESRRARAVGQFKDRAHQAVMNATIEGEVSTA